MACKHTFIDVSVEALADLLKLSEHDVSISGIGIDPAQMRLGVIRFYLKGEALPVGQVKATYERRADRVILKALEPVR